MPVEFILLNKYLAKLQGEPFFVIKFNMFNSIRLCQTLDKPNFRFSSTFIFFIQYCIRKTLTAENLAVCWLSVGCLLAVCFTFGLAYSISVSQTGRISDICPAIRKIREEQYICQKYVCFFFILSHCIICYWKGLCLCFVFKKNLTDLLYLS